MCLCVQSVYIEVVAPCWYVFVSSILIIICAQARVNYYESEVKQLSLMSLSLCQEMEASGNQVKKLGPSGRKGRSGGKKDIS